MNWFKENILLFLLKKTVDFEIFFTTFCFILALRHWKRLRNYYKKWEDIEV